MALLKRLSLIAHRLGRLPGSARNVRTLGPLALALAIIAAGAILLGPVAHQRPSASTGANVGAANGAPMRIARADVHVESRSNGKDLELNVVITQTQNDCQAPLTVGFCLRYSVVLDEEPVMVGYGVIPQSNVHVTPFGIALTVDTSKVPGFVNVVGSGGPISITWKTVPPTARVGVMRQVTARGTLVSHEIPTNGTIATMLVQ
ncbi:MAG TPA: hypothetical protein VFU63_10330 [Ktedonobacterales bacterium]|nr:hypothetical protein [Ktedonobacterales bacterium]